MDMQKILQLRKKANSLPMEPGVYLMKDNKNQIIYVGKAKLLKNRVTSYFRAVESHQAKVYKMVEHVDDFDYIVTDSEFEALVLECSLIKLHSPKYNILLKDDKGYYYVMISPAPYSKITAQKQKTDPLATYLGPYTSSSVVKQTVDEANKVFGLPTCARQFPRDIRKGRPCLNYHIKQCMGVCNGKISQERYQESLEEAVAFIKTGGESSVEMLTQKMYEASESLDFERAARYRDRIRSIQKITERQKVIAYHHKNLDVIAAVQGGEQVYLAVLILRDGCMRDKRDFVFECFDSIAAVERDFLLSYYLSMPQSEMPSELFVDCEVPDQEIIAEMLTERAGKKCTITVPQRGAGKNLIEMAKNNAGQVLALKKGRTGREMSALTELGRILGLSSAPEYIEAYDISNIGGQTIVGGMVVFEQGRPQRRLYKKFHIRDQKTPDDYAAMDQMLSRRIERYLNPEKKDEGFDRLPDLWLIDGGAGHVAVAKEVLKRYELEIPVFGMVKDNRHRTRAVSSETDEISISANHGVFTLVTMIQDEVHRYSIEYSRSTHRKNSLVSRLTDVEGIGETRANSLLKQFKTLKKMKDASEAELAAVKGMTGTAARNLYCYLHQSD